MERLIIWLLVVLVILATCAVKPNAARIFLGGFFILMGLGFHLILILLNPHGYDGYSSSALLGLYRWGFREVVLRAPLAFAIAAATFEIVVGLLMLGKRQAAKRGLVLGALFLFAITPLGFETLPNALLALGLAYLSTYEFSSSVWDMVRATRQHLRDSPG